MDRREMLAQLIERYRAAPGVFEQEMMMHVLIERVRSNLDLIVCVAITALCIGLAIPRP